MWKINLSFLFLIQSIFAFSTEAYLEILSKEIDQKTINSQLNLIYNDPLYKKVLKIEKEKKEIKQYGKTFLVIDFMKVLKLLNTLDSKNKSYLPAYLAVQLIKEQWGFKTVRINENYGKKLTQQLYEYRLCDGYYYYAKLLWKDEHKKKSLNILKEGKLNCKNNAYLLLKIKKSYALYNYYLNKGK